MRKFCVSLRPITSLIFMSTVRPGMDQQDFLAIMGAAQRNSARFGLTGLLACNGFNFMQCIEGERAAVKDRMYHIMHDDRHSGIVILHQSERDTRQFAKLYIDHRYFPAVSGATQFELSTILSEYTVSDVVRTLFQSFSSLGLQATRQ